jgi:hypothetical protein
VINQETSVGATVAEEVVERDLDFFVPLREHRELLGSLYVPLMRVAAIQLQIVLQRLRTQYYQALQVRLCGVVGGTQSTATDRLICS